MGKRFLRTIVSDFQTLAASADITPVDLPVNPLSYLVLTIEGTASNPDGAAGNYSKVSDFASGITDVSVRHRGENVIQGQLEDVMVLNALLTRYRPWGTKIDSDLARVRTMSFILSFSRRPYWHEEGFPATARGNLRFHMTAGALPAAFSARRWALEAVELIEDAPSRYLKYTTNQRALSATGRQKVPLPIGNEILGVLLFDPTTENQDPASYAWHKVKLLKDNVEQYYPEVGWEALRDRVAQRAASPDGLGGHTHFVTAAQMNQTAVANTAARTEEDEHEKSQAPNRYGYLDFDPLDDGSWSLETAGAASLDLDLNSDVNTGTIRYLPVELIKVAGGAAGA